jgi:hypothetical protein
MKKEDVKLKKEMNEKQEKQVELMQGCWDKSNNQHYSTPDMTTNSSLAVIRQSKIARDWLNLTRSGTGSKCKCTTHTLCSLRQK